MKDIRQLDKLLSPLFHCLFYGQLYVYDYHHCDNYEEMRTNFHYLLISSSLSPRITLGRAYTLVLLDFLLFFLPNSVISMFSQLKNSAPGKIKLSKLYFCLECFSPHFSSYHAFTS